MTSMQTLKAELSELDQRLYAAWRLEREDARRQIVALAIEFQLSPDVVAMDVSSGHRSAEPPAHLMKAPKVDLPLRGQGVVQFIAPKYRHPQTNQTWSGRGRAPQWVNDLRGAGSTLEDLLIAVESTESTDPLRNFQDAAKRQQLKVASKHVPRGKKGGAGRGKKGGSARGKTPGLNAG